MGFALLLAIVSIIVRSNAFVYRQRMVHIDARSKYQFGSTSSNSEELPTVISSDLVNRIREYLEVRNSTPIENVIEGSSIPEKPEYNFLSMFKPSGWYRDEAALDLEARSDKRVPKILHPLSYIELRKYGFEDLQLPIIELGGPYVVADLIGLDWVEPELPPEVWDESLWPTRQLFYALDFRGSLLLGDALEERLSLAEGMDLEELKAEIQSNLKRNVTYASIGNDNLNYLYNTKQLKSKSSPYPSVPAISQIDFSDRFNLPIPQRVYLTTTSFLLAFAWGHATSDLMAIVDIPGALFVVEVARVLSLTLLASSAVSAAAAVPLSGSKGRNQAVWLWKALLGGPLAVSQLRDLPSKTGTFPSTENTI